MGYESNDGDYGFDLSNMPELDLQNGIILDLRGALPEDDPMPEAGFEVDDFDIDEIDLSDVKVGTRVKHEFFGDGQIAAFLEEERRIRVKFEEEEMEFLFPDAFEEGFLTL